MIYYLFVCERCQDQVVMNVCMKAQPPFLWRRPEEHERRSAESAAAGLDGTLAQLPGTPRNSQEHSNRYFHHL